MPLAALWYQTNDRFSDAMFGNKKNVMKTVHHGEALSSSVRRILKRGGPKISENLGRTKI